MKFYKYRYEGTSSLWDTTYYLVMGEVYYIWLSDEWSRWRSTKWARGSFKPNVQKVETTQLEVLIVLGPKAIKEAYKLKEEANE